MDTVRLIVNADKCIGSGMCEMLEEQLFVVDEDTHVARVEGRGVLSKERALIVIDRCPSGAIVELAPGDSTLPEQSPDV